MPVRHSTPRINKNELIYLYWVIFFHKLYPPLQWLFIIFTEHSQFLSSKRWAWLPVLPIFSQLWHANDVLMSMNPGIILIEWWLGGFSRLSHVMVWWVVVCYQRGSDDIRPHCHSNSDRWQARWQLLISHYYLISVPYVCSHHRVWQINPTSQAKRPKHSLNEYSIIFSNRIFQYDH